MTTLLRREIAWLSLERDFFVMIFTILLLTMGNQLWSRFIPVYLEYLGASALIIGAYGSLKSVLNSVYQYPGGAISDKLGSKRALVLFVYFPLHNRILDILDIQRLGDLLFWDTLRPHLG